MTISKNKEIEVVSASEAETRRLGKKIGAHLKKGDVVALHGELGAGKTTLVKGIASAFGVYEGEVSSPTFVLINEYHGSMPVYHMDWYRLDAVEGGDREEALERFESNGISIVEWAERGQLILPADTLDIRLEHAGGARRRISVRMRTERHQPLLETLKKR